MKLEGLYYETPLNILEVENAGDLQLGSRVQYQTHDCGHRVDSNGEHFTPAQPATHTGIFCGVSSAGYALVRGNDIVRAADARTLAVVDARPSTVKALREKALAGICYSPTPTNWGKNENGHGTWLEVEGAVKFPSATPVWPCRPAAGY